MHLRSKGPASKPACFRGPRATTWIPRHRQRPGRSWSPSPASSWSWRIRARSPGGQPPMGRGTRLQAEKAGHCLTLDSGLKQSCTGGDFQLLTQTTAAVGEVDGAGGCLQPTPRRPRTPAQACPHSELTAKALGECQVHMPTETPLTVPRRAPPRPETQASRRWLSKAGRPSGTLQRECAAPSPSSRSVLSGYPHSAQGPWFPGGGVPWVLPQPQEARGRDWPSASLCQVQAPGTPQLPQLPPRASSWEPSTA